MMRETINANNNDHWPWYYRYGIHSVTLDVVGSKNRDFASRLLDFIGE